MKKDRFREIVLQSVPRILGLIDRDENSRTYGCCDRYYWHYKLHDLPNARFQEICLLLSLLYRSEFPGNRYYRKGKVLKWIKAVISFWLSRINRDGSQSEIYPFERSFCATSFSSFAVTESLLLQMEDADSREIIVPGFAHKEVLERLEKTGRWVGSHFKRDVANQLAAAVACLANIRRVTGNPLHQEMAALGFDMLRSDYRTHGYCPEYGGFDTGYSSITNSCLAWYSKNAPNADEIRSMISGICQHIDERIDALGNCDCRDNSRKTQFLYPYGFLVAGSPVLDRLLAGIRADAAITPLWLDDRYCIGLTIDYLKTFLEMTPPPPARGMPGHAV